MVFRVFNYEITFILFLNCSQKELRKNTMQCLNWYFKIYFVKVKYFTCYFLYFYKYFYILYLYIFIFLYYIYFYILLK